MQRGGLGEFYAREIGRVYEDAGIPDVGAVFQDGDSGGHKLPEFAHRRGFERLVRDFAHKRRKQLYFVHAVGGRVYRALEFLHPELAVYPQPSFSNSLRSGMQIFADSLVRFSSAPQ